MKLQSLVIAAVMALPVVSFAQSNQPLTRAEVRAQRVELQKAGYNPASDEAQYPINIEAVQARVDAQQNIVNSSYGAASGFASAAGASAKAHDVIGLGPIYARP